MLTPSQIKQLAELVNEAGIAIKDIDAINEYIGLILEDIAGFESVTVDELAKIQIDVLSALKSC